MIVVLDYGMGNIHSIIKALELYYPDVVYTNDKNKIKNAKGLVLPGDGHFHTAMLHLQNLKDSIYEHISKEKPLLGICIGFQILFEDSDEVLKEYNQPTIEGLKLISGKIRKFSIKNKNFKIPHMGWNQLIPNTKHFSNVPDYFNTYMYFIHSYRAVNVDDSYVLTWTEYAGELFPSTVKKNYIWGCQYHPEKSDIAGLEFLKDWIKQL
ncbi:MAG: imidazole glycerol phosphate synthase subunit HisH [Leptospiraceae bacterium]|nr:MAG: imidazole glycerol phosphate synthase subunit HisH [Leptospiraceae bacterium]